jgi:hypothetical protein
MEMSASDKQLSNADSPITNLRSRKSKVTLTSAEQPSKQDSEIVSTEAGMQMTRSARHWQKVDSPKVEILQPYSKTT